MLVKLKEVNESTLVERIYARRTNPQNLLDGYNTVQSDELREKIQSWKKLGKNALFVVYDDSIFHRAISGA